jgi:hypothetical protein
MPTKGLFEEGKERPGRRSRRSVEAGERNRQDSALLQWPVVDQGGLPRQWRAEALHVRNYYKGYGGRTFIMSHGTSRKKWKMGEQWQWQ